MDCWHPLELRNKGFDDLVKKVLNLHRVVESPQNFPLFNNVNVLSMLDKYTTLLEVTPEYIKVPCRKCPPCLKKRSSEWSGRLLRETLYWFNRNKKVLFCTFTYDRKYINSARKSYKNDIAIMFDKLRSKYRRNLRHWCIPELGEKNGRFHVHALIFDVPDIFAPDSHLHRSKNGAIHGSNKIIKEMWSKGLVDVGFLKEVKGANYMVSYLTKISESSLKANNGFIFKGGIVCSNKIGFLEMSEDEICKVVTQIQRLENPHYDIGNLTFSYPLSWLQKYISPFGLRNASYTNSLRRLSKGGDFVFHKEYFKTYEEYKLRQSLSLANVVYYHKPIYYRLNTLLNNSNFEFENLI